LDLKVDINERKEGGYLVTLKGSLDNNTYIECGEKLQQIISKKPKVIVLDMRELDYISSAGIGLICKAKHALDKYNGTVKLANLQPKVKNVLDSLKLFSDEFLATMDGKDEVLDEYIDFIISKYKEDGK